MAPREQLRSGATGMTLDELEDAQRHWRDEAEQAKALERWNTPFRHGVGDFRADPHPHDVPPDGGLSTGPPPGDDAPIREKLAWAKAAHACSPLEYRLTSCADCDAQIAYCGRPDEMPTTPRCPRCAQEAQTA